MTNLTRAMIIDAVDCTVCKAKAGQRCFQKNGKKHKSSVHHQRMTKAQSAYGLRKKKRASPHRETGKADFYSSWEWKKLRFATLERLGRRCMCCGWSPSDGTKGHLCVDHIKPRSKFPALELEPSNMQVLCNSCNMGKSNVSTTRFEEYEAGPELEIHWIDAAFSGTIQ